MTTPPTMHAVLLTGFGGLDRLEYRTDVPVPRPASDQVLVEVGGAGVNNTDVNTRTGWYSKQVRDATGDGGSSGWGDAVADDGGWSGESIEFPRIQGADVAGRIVQVGSDVSGERIGERVIVRTMQAPLPGSSLGTITLGSEIDGGFAQFCAVRASEAYAIDSSLTDVELASFPCAASTAEGMLAKAAVGRGERVLVTGASGGVGSAAVQLARRRGAEVVAVASTSKHGRLTELGATDVLDRGADPVAALGEEAVDVVVDLVGGDRWPRLLDVVRRHGRYVTSGAIAGPIVELDLRTLYLKDLTLLGSTEQPPHVFADLVAAIERGEIQPVVAATYPLREIAAAQQRFLDKDFFGKIVLIPPAP